MDRRAWQGTDHGVTKSQTLVRDYHLHFHLILHHPNEIISSSLLILSIKTNYFSIIKKGRSLEGGSGWGTHVNPWLFHFNV